MRYSGRDAAKLLLVPCGIRFCLIAIAATAVDFWRMFGLQYYDIIGLVAHIDSMCPGLSSWCDHRLRSSATPIDVLPYPGPLHSPHDTRLHDA